MNWHERRGIKQREPVTVKLQLPDIRQQAEYDCGAAAVDTVLRFLGVRTCAAVQFSSPVDGTHPVTIEHVLRRCGLKVQAGTFDLTDLKHHTHRGRPVLCPVNLYGGHWVVVAGVERGRVYFQCPADGPRSLLLAEWLSIWRDSTRSGHDFDTWGIVAGV